MFTEQKWSAAKRVPREAHALYCKCAQRIRNRVFTKHGAGARGCGAREPDSAILANLLFPYIQDPWQGQEFFYSAAQCRVKTHRVWHDSSMSGFQQEVTTLETFWKRIFLKSE